LVHFEPTSRKVEERRTERKWPTSPNAARRDTRVLAEGGVRSQTTRRINRLDPGVSFVPESRFGRYRLVERLGSGQQGQVWKAIQVEPFVEMVALKVLSPNLAHDPKRLAQFHREAELGAQLDNPALLQTYEYGEINGMAFMTMPLVNGCSLERVLNDLSARDVSGNRRSGGWWIQLPQRDYQAAMTRLVSRIARALAVAHSNLVVHRDVKPANILMDYDREDKVYLADFGLSRDLDGPPPRSFLYGTGTPLYMAPEKLSAQVSDDRLCDIYALGVTLCEAVTRTHPFQVPASLDASEWVAYLAVATPSRPREVCPEIPGALEAVILKAMHRDPRERYQRASAFANDLDQFLEGHA